MRSAVGVSLLVAVTTLAGCQCTDGVRQPDPLPDAGAALGDAGVDAGTPDGGDRDAGALDGGRADAGVDGGAPDAAGLDAGFDAGSPDAGQPDAGPLDAGAVTLELDVPYSTVIYGTPTRKQLLTLRLRRGSAPIAGAALELSGASGCYDVALADAGLGPVPLVTDARGEATVVFAVNAADVCPNPCTLTASAPAHGVERTATVLVDVPRCVVTFDTCAPARDVDCLLFDERSSYGRTTRFSVKAFDGMDAGLPALSPTARWRTGNPAIADVTFDALTTDDAGLLRGVLTARGGLGGGATWSSELNFCGTDRIYGGAAVIGVGDGQPTSVTLTCPDAVDPDAGFSCALGVLGVGGQDLGAAPLPLVAWAEGSAFARAEWRPGTDLLHFTRVGEPLDVEPWSSPLEPRWDAGTRVLNPRDGYATVAVAVWVNQPLAFAEPFLDLDDDGAWDGGEPLVDADGDGRWSIVAADGGADGGWRWATAVVHYRRAPDLSRASLAPQADWVIPRGDRRLFWLTIADEVLNAPARGAFSLSLPSRTRLTSFDAPWQGVATAQPTARVSVCSGQVCWPRTTFPSFYEGVSSLATIENVTPASSGEPALDAGLVLTLTHDGGAAESRTWPITVE